MKTTQAIITTLVLAIALTIIGMMSYEYLIATFLFPKITSLQATVTSIGSRFSNALGFGAICGFLPIALYSIWSITHTKENRKKFLSIALILLCMLASLAIRYSIIAAAAQKTNTSSGGITMNAYDINDLHYALYLFFGLLTGSLISFIILKRK